MKNTKKRGFTIVELVVVIAVIAILASVLIPTFSNVVKNARKSKNLQDVRNVYTQALAEHLAEETPCTNKTHTITQGSVSWTVTFTDADTATVENSEISCTITKGVFGEITPKTATPAPDGGGNAGGGQDAGTGNNGGGAGNPG